MKFKALIFIGSFFVCHAQAAVRVSWEVTHFDAKGIAESRRTITEDASKQRIDESASDVAVILRADIGKKWILNKREKSYREYELTPSTFQVKIASEACLVQKKMWLDPSLSLTDVGNYRCTVSSLSLDLLCADDEEDENAESLRLQFRAKIWAPDHPIIQQRFTYDDWPDVLQLNIRQRRANLIALQKTFTNFVRYFSQFAGAKKDLLKNLNQPYIKYYSSDVIIYGNKPIAFSKQQRSVTHQRVDAGSTPTSVPELVSNAAALGIIHGLIAFKSHPQIPDWVLDVDPDFPIHGGHAQRNELVDFQEVNDPACFNIPTDYVLLK